MNNLSIILPCYNPPKDWEKVVVQTMKSIQTSLSQSVSLFIVNDGSPQSVDKEINYIKTQIPELTYIDSPINKGKGYALRSGVAQANTPYIIYTDIDFPYTTDSLLQVYAQLQAGYDVVAGVKDSSYYTNTPLVRKWISKLLRFGIRLCLNMHITDTQCGLKGFNLQGKQVFLNTTIDRYLFDLEFIYLSSQKKSNINITSVPAILRPGIIFRKMNYKVLLQESRNFIKILFK